jgi:hypothetical protein
MQMNGIFSAISSTELNMQLLTANWPITETEYVVIRYGSVVLAFCLGWLISKLFVSGSEQLVFGPGWTVYHLESG